MKKWTENNLHEFDIEAADMGHNQQQVASWVEGHIFENATIETIDDMLANADDYIKLAYVSLEWTGQPSTGGLVVNVW